ncbi:hypothetical protein BU14_0946s0006 [Porphyra umbilicalis]|uniref:Protochlorophyllide reductase n=1 Tax=Porphyra umbilicalis TaxID=2786 RepID=A0A1X6NN06_PORUM|nr:hypothetical protein BU14_0946s0006 [Porphyra umbilicalis]|eukprot:OSX70029.1 hypothetical protein BU14_0946s0006 [Porphyra umbilicalis]
MAPPATPPLNSKSTADDVLAGQTLTGTTIVVTGGGGGIGEETARSLAAAGATVFVGCRRTSQADGIVAAATAAAAANGRGGSVTAVTLDLTDLASVRAFAESVKTALGDRRLDVLILNAGVMACPLSRTAHGWELQMATNHLGHVHLTQALLPAAASAPEPVTSLPLSAAAAAEASRGTRVVVVSSALHRAATRSGGLDVADLHFTTGGRKYTRYGAYSDSKLANVLFARGLAARGVDAVSLHPGVIATGLVRHHTIIGPLYRAIGPLFLKSIPAGAATSVAAALRAVGAPGDYLADCGVGSAVAAAGDVDLRERLWSETQRELDAALAGQPYAPPTVAGV